MFFSSKVELTLMQIQQNRIYFHANGLFKIEYGTLLQVINIVNILFIS